MTFTDVITLGFEIIIQFSVFFGEKSLNIIRTVFWSDLDRNESKIELLLQKYQQSLETFEIEMQSLKKREKTSSDKDIQTDEVQSSETGGNGGEVIMSE